MKNREGNNMAEEEGGPTFFAILCFSDHSLERLHLNKPENCLVLFPYQETSHPTFNPLNTLLELLNQYSEAQVSDFISSPLTMEWRPSKCEHPKNKVIQRKWDYLKYYRNPCEEIFPLVLASYTKHIVLGGFPIDSLQHIFSILDPRSENCFGCQKTIVRASQSAQLNCGCVYRKCIACKNRTYHVQANKGQGCVAFDHCTCPRCSTPRRISVFDDNKTTQCTRGYYVSYLTVIGQLHCNCQHKCFQCTNKVTYKWLLWGSVPWERDKDVRPKAWCGCLQMTYEPSHGATGF
jgi:hypothetical protein